MSYIHYVISVIDIILGVTMVVLAVKEWPHMLGWSELKYNLVFFLVGIVIFTSGIMIW
jgi:hypothetical protein